MASLSAGNNLLAANLIHNESSPIESLQRENKNEVRERKKNGRTKKKKGGEWGETDGKRQGKFLGESLDCTQLQQQHIFVQMSASIDTSSFLNFCN